MTQTSRKHSVLITCEHGGNTVPLAWRDLFEGAEQELASHRGWDPGALQIARSFARTLRAPLKHSTVTRLLVELNRSLHHSSLFSEFTNDLPPEQKQHLLDTYWHPFRNWVSTTIETEARAGRRVIHVSVHSFTPLIRGVVRSTDIGLLFDPGRRGESRLCREWQRRLQTAFPELKTHRNQPYKGVSDGFTTHLRKRFTDNQYVGIELEINQKHLAKRTGFGARMRSELPRLFNAALDVA